MVFAKDKANLEGVLLGNLLVNSDYMSLGQLYARMRADSRVDFDMPRLMKVLSLDINKGYVVWGFNGYTGEVMLQLTQKGRVETAIRIKENKAWLPEDYKKPNDVEDISDQFCAGMVLPPVDEPLYKKAPAEESSEDDEDYWAEGDEFLPDDEVEDSDTTSDHNEPEEGISPSVGTGKSDTATLRTIMFDGEKAFWTDTNEELTTEEYEDILGITKDGLAELSAGYCEECEECGECEECAEAHKENAQETAGVQYCYFCGAASDQQANFCNRCGHRLISGSCNPGITGARFRLVYGEPEVTVRKCQSADNLYQRNILNSMDALYYMLEEMGALD